MKELVIMAAQSSSIKGDIESNIRTHVEIVDLAAKHNADVIIFPELSLSGYEPEIAREVTITLDDERLAPLKDRARRYGITIIAGAPIACSEGKPYIGALILGPDNSFSYLKIHLHSSEEEFFSPGEKSCVMSVNGMNIGVAICADINHASHAEKAAKQGASIYAASVLLSESAYPKDARLLEQYATRHSMAVVMANHGSPSGGYISAGRSALWDDTGKLLTAAEAVGDALVMAVKDQGKWSGETIKI